MAVQAGSCMRDVTCGSCCSCSWVQRQRMRLPQSGGLEGAALLNQPAPPQAGHVGGDGAAWATAGAGPAGSRSSAGRCSAAWASSASG